MRALFIAILALLLLYGYAEGKRWRSPELSGILTRNQKLRRLICYIALLVVVLMTIGGTYFPTTHISARVAAAEMVFWSLWLVLAALIAVIAAREMRITLSQQSLKEARQERDLALRDVVETVAKAELESKRKKELPSRNGHG